MKSIFHFVLQEFYLITSSLAAYRRPSFLQLHGTAIDKKQTIASVTMG